MLEVSGLGKRYPEGVREREVLRDVSFEIFAGDSVGLWGTARSGKSTLLRILAGIEPPDSGSVRFDDVELTTLAHDAKIRFLRDRVGLASFGWSSHRNRLVCEHVALAASADPGMTGRKARVLARRALSRVEADCADRTLERLSLDEHIRVELARALVRAPRLLLIDDPPRLQSPHENTALYELLRSLSDEPDQTVLVASCELQPLQGAKRMMAIGQGRLRRMDDPGTVIEFPDRTGTDGP
jgi:putative ABC transport system ATP-binding protein